LYGWATHNARPATIEVDQYLVARSFTLPLYEYRCKSCGHQFEKIQSFSAPYVKVCPVCKGEVERLISAPAIRFKGSGFYETDYHSKTRNESHTSSPSPAATPSSSAASDASSAKPAAPGTTSSSNTPSGNS